MIVMKAMLEDNDILVSSLKNQLEESERNATSFRQRIDEALRKMASLELHLQHLSMMHTSQIVNDPIATEAEDMLDFINAMDSSALLDSSPMERARTSLFAYPFIQRSRVCTEKEEIAILRDKLEKCMRENEAANATAAEAYVEAVAAKKARKNVQIVRRGIQGSSGPRDSEAYKRWFQR